MTIQTYTASHLRLSSKSGTYLYWPVHEWEYKRISRYVARGWFGKAWQMLKGKKFEKN